jgi:hypothetical protein
MTFDHLITVIKDVGFPIAVAIYLLWRYDQRMKEMADVLGEIAKTMEVIKNCVQDDHHG